MLFCAVHRCIACAFIAFIVSLRREREDAMKGIPCNDYLHTPKARKDRIVYRFVSDDGNTPSACTVRIGDEDPVTGETVSDTDCFLEYYRLVDHQVYIQNRETKGLLYLDGFPDNEDRDPRERLRAFSVPADDPFDDVPDRILRLREIAASLCGRQADIYEALLVKYAGGKEKISMTDIARKWGVSVTQICMDRDRIIRMIREKVF